MRYALFLDDCRDINPLFKILCYRCGINEFVLAKNYDEFFEVLCVYGMPSAISFDHDLADAHYGGDFSKEKTGFDCAKLLTDYMMDISPEMLAEEFYPKFFFQVHSMNPVGAENIRAFLIQFFKLKMDKDFYIA